MKKCLLPVFLLMAMGSFAQLSEAYKELRIFSKKKQLLPADSSIYLNNFYQNGLHYLLPLYKAFFQEQRLLKVDTSLYYDNLTQAVSFAGDNASVLELEKIRQCGLKVTSSNMVKSYKLFRML